MHTEDWGGETGVQEKQLTHPVCIKVGQWRYEQAQVSPFGAEMHTLHKSLNSCGVDKGAGGA